MQVERAYEFSPSVKNAEKVIAVGTGAALLACGAVRRSPAGAWIAAASVPFFYRAFAGHWPEPFRALGANGNAKKALSGDRGAHVREAVRLRPADPRGNRSSRPTQSPKRLLPPRNTHEDSRVQHPRTKEIVTMAQAGTLHDAFMDELRDAYDARNS